MSKKIAGKARSLAAPLTDKMGLELVDTEFVKEGSNWYLRVYIDKIGGISIDDCEAVSKVFSDLLDDADFIPHAYVLEVSSPGLDRPLASDADYRRYAGELLEIRMSAKPGGGGETAGGADGGCLPGSGAGGGESGEGGGRDRGRSGGGAGREKRQGMARNGARGRDEARVVYGELVKLENGIIYVTDESGSQAGIPLKDVEEVRRAIRFG
jgi:ribosome maturation factor RimP